MKPMLAALLALSVAGCSAGGGATSYQALATYGMADRQGDIAESNLLVRIPEWGGAIKKAHQTVGASGLRQEVVIAGGTRGDNVVEVSVAAHNSDSLGFSTSHNPSDAEIGDELRAKFPGVEMHLLAEARRDVDGPYRLAIGRAPDGTDCLYAWRWTDNLRETADPSGIATVQAAFAHEAPAASLRIRLCNKYVTLDDLASLAEQIRFVPIPDVDRILAGRPSQAEAPAPRIDATLGPTLESAIVDPPHETSATPKHVALASKPVRRRLAHRRHHTQPVAAEAGSYLSPISGERYLAPLPSTPSMAQSSASEASPMRPPASAVSSGASGLNLPAAAYRGPSGVQ